MFTRASRLVKNVGSIASRHFTTRVVNNPFNKVHLAVLATGTVFVDATIYQNQNRFRANQVPIDDQENTAIRMQRVIVIEGFADFIIDEIKANPNITKDEIYSSLISEIDFDEDLIQMFDLAYAMAGAEIAMGLKMRNDVGFVKI